MNTFGRRGRYHNIRIGAWGRQKPAGGVGTGMMAQARVPRRTTGSWRTGWEGFLWVEEKRIYRTKGWGSIWEDHLPPNWPSIPEVTTVSLSASFLSSITLRSPQSEVTASFFVASASHSWFVLGVDENGNLLGFPHGPCLDIQAPCRWPSVTAMSVTSRIPSFVC